MKQSYEQWINQIANDNKPSYELLDFEEVVNVGEWMAFKYKEIEYTWEFIFYSETLN
jgi:hypothetical protein